MSAARPLHMSVVIPCAVAPLLAACTGLGPMEALDEPDRQATAVVASHPTPHVTLPFHLDADAVLVGQVLAPDFGPPTFGRSDFDGRCSTPSDYLVSFEMWGEATHLGAFTGAASDCGQIDFQTGGTTLSDGRLTLTAADGDQLWGVFERQGMSEDALEDHTFVGGTGRFSDASGSGLGDATCDRAAGTCVFTMHGTIAYGASAAAVR